MRKEFSPMSPEQLEAHRLEEITTRAMIKALLELEKKQAELMRELKTTQVT
jgi:hypothetical protein